MLLGSVLVRCAPSSSNLPTVESKVFALTPQDYSGKPVQVVGRVAALGDAGAFFYLEDLTGRVLVSTAVFPHPLNCQVGQQVRVVGAWQAASSGALEPSCFLAQDVFCAAEGAPLGRSLR